MFTEAFLSFMHGWVGVPVQERVPGAFRGVCSRRTLVEERGKVKVFQPAFQVSINGMYKFGVHDPEEVVVVYGDTRDP